jgi:hypothetical protein
VVDQSASQERPVDGRHDLFEGVGDLLFVKDLDRGRALAYDHDGGRGLDPLYAQQLKVLEEVVRSQAARELAARAWVAVRSASV